MSFRDQPILNSPYQSPSRHWELRDGVPSGAVKQGRRSSVYMLPVPPAARGRGQAQVGLLPEKETENPHVNEVRALVERWRKLPARNNGLAGSSNKLLAHWRGARINPRLFFCQIEAIETLIWLNEVAPDTAAGKKLLAQLKAENDAANPGLPRIATKMATGSGKTVVMAMLIAYHAVGRARNPNNPRFAEHFLVVTPGLPIKDRLRVLLPHDPNNYYAAHNLVPEELQGCMQRAEVTVVNRHVFGVRDNRLYNFNQGNRAKQLKVLRGHGDEVQTQETPAQMLQRACGKLLAADRVVVINDEAHHCYRENQEAQVSRAQNQNRDADELAEAKYEKETAFQWISGLEALTAALPKGAVRAVHDLSATPFFLSASGYREGSMFPWVVSDFALMDAIECGIVKLPRVPTADDAVTPDRVPIYRNLYAHIKDELRAGGADPRDLPAQLLGALATLYAHYEKEHAAWQKVSPVPPAFIIVCNNTATSKRVYDYVGGYPTGDGDTWRGGEFSLFGNVDEDGKPHALPRTLLIDSKQLDGGRDSGGNAQITARFKAAAAAEIDAFKREMRTRHPDRDLPITDDDLLREMMNTVGKPGKLGAQVRCVVSVSMLSEGWDASNVTHILGIRKFGTQLLCEQVVGRGLRRMSYAADENAMLASEYANVFGVPFHFVQSGGQTEPKPPPEKTRIHALRERDGYAVEFPRVLGYRQTPGADRLNAVFTPESTLTIAPEDAPPRVTAEAIIGEGVEMSLDELRGERMNKVEFRLAAYTAGRYYRDQRGQVAPALFRDLVLIIRRWIDEGYLQCLGDTFAQYLLFPTFARQAAEIIHRACTSVSSEESLLLPLLDHYRPIGGTASVDYETQRDPALLFAAAKSHINFAVCDSGWEVEFCKILESEPRVFCYARNDAGLAFSLPYTYDGEEHRYYPDYIIKIGGRDAADATLNLIVEVKGKRDNRAIAKADTAKRLWVPAVDNHGGFGRWDYLEITADPADGVPRQQLAAFINALPPLASG